MFASQQHPHGPPFPGPLPVAMQQRPPLGSPSLLGFKPLAGSNDDLNGTDMDSDVGSDNEDIADIDSEKLDASHREILEKLKRQEMEEREEIERELKEAQREALVRAHRQEEFRAQELRAQELHAREEGKERQERDLHGSSTPPQTEIKTQRPLGLLAQHGLTTKSHHHLFDRERADRVAGVVTGRGKEQRREPDNQDRDRDRDRDRNSLTGEKEEDEEDNDCQDEDWPSPTGPQDRPPLLPLTTGPNPLDFPHPAFMDRPFGPPASSLSPHQHDRHVESPGTPTTPNPPPGGHDSGGSNGTSSGGHHWTFEEQFKQLYELSDDTKRKEFLDDLFAFMQKRGTPVNRIPIMAKQTLDLYELFRLVVSKGGLVEVINKKLWREITKGLNLPSSITSAAFTLRTQYMKYLYPYECEKLKLSSPGELQAAIDGNRREGRRPSYGYDFSPIPTMIPTPPTPHLNGGFHSHPLNGRPGPLSPKDDDRSLLNTPPNHLHTLAERDARAMEAAARAMEEATKRMEEASRSVITAGITSTTNSTPLMSSKPLDCPSHHHRPSIGGPDDHPPPPKRPLLSDDRSLLAHMGMPSAHMKITGRSDGRSDFDNSLVVSMEINGIMYQGVLFAQHHQRRM